MLSKAIRHSRSLPMIGQIPCNQETMFIMLHGIEPSLSVRPLQAACDFMFTLGDLAATVLQATVTHVASSCFSGWPLRKGIHKEVKP